MSLLIFAIEAGRFGPARLPEALAKAGLTSVALCPADNLLASSRHLRGLVLLDCGRSAGAMARRLDAAVQHFQTKLIIPADEQAVVLLQALCRAPLMRHLSPAAHAVVARSMGDPAGHGASLYKSETMALARRVGVPVPAGGEVSNVSAAVAMSDQVGLPVFVKQSFSWAGRGVVRCTDVAQVAEAYRNGASRPGWARTVARKALGRDWYPAQTAIDIQAAVPGEVAMFCALAWHGRLAGGFAARKLELAYPNGPSKSVRLCDHPAMRMAAATMIEHLGFHGFLSFDFVLPCDDAPQLIECNPRPVPVAHLGGHVGVNLPALLAALLRGGEVPAQPVKAQGQADILLFPHSLKANNLNGTILADLPENDPALIAAMQAA